MHRHQITPGVSGPVVKLPGVDNQFVKAGDLLLKIDPRTFDANLQQAQAERDNTRDQIEALEKEVEAAQADIDAALATIKQTEAAVSAYTGRLAETRAEYNRQISLDKKGATLPKCPRGLPCGWEQRSRSW
jgi:multidrug resistance efflux pump